MIKKFKNLSLLFVALFCVSIINVNAKSFTPDEIEDFSTETVGGAEIQDTVYIFGSHVYFNSITMAQLVEAANTLNGKTNAKLYYKDGSGTWKNGVSNTVIPATELATLSFDVTKIVKEGEHEGISGEDDGEVITEGNNTVELFSLENVEGIAINSIKLASAPSTFTATEKQAYSFIQNSSTVTFDKANKVITIKEKYAPMSAGESRTIDLLINAGKALESQYIGCNEGDGFVTEEECATEQRQYNYYNIKLQTYDYTGIGANSTLIPEYGISYTTYGATGNEFLINLPLHDETATGKIYIYEYDENGNTIALDSYTLKFEAMVEIDEFTTETEEELEISPETTGIVITKKEWLDGEGDDPYNAKYSVSIPYKLNGTKPEVFKYTRDGVEWTAQKHVTGPTTTYNHYVEEIDLKSVTVGVPTNVTFATPEEKVRHTFNQSAITVASAASTAENIDYEITITETKLPKVDASGKRWIALLVDLGVEPYDDDTQNIKGVEATGFVKYNIEQIDITDAHAHGTTNNTTFVMWLDVNSINTTNGNVYKFTTDESGDDDTIVIKVNPVVNNIDELEVTEVKVATYGSISETELINNQYKYNLGSISPKLEYDDENNKYVLTIKETRDMEKFVGGNSETPKDWFALIVKTNALVKELVGGNYEIEEIDYKDALRHGATANDNKEFVMWLTGGDADYTRTVTLTDKVTNTQVTLEIKYQAVTEYEYKGISTVIYEKEFTVDTIGVTYDATRGVFIIRDGITQFDITVGANKYRFVYNDSTNTWNTPIKSLRIAHAYAALNKSEYTDLQKYNQDSFKSIVVDNEKDEINITFNRALAQYTANGTEGKWYGIVIDLDVDSDKVGTLAGYTIETLDKTDANYHVSAANASENNIVLWINANVGEGKKTITFVNTDDPTNKVKLEVDINVTEENSLSLANAKKAIMTDAISTNADDYAEMVYNQASIESVEIKNGEVVVNTNRDLLSYVNGSTLDERWYAILIDLGIAKADLSTTGGYTIQTVDKECAYQWTGTGNEVILWLRAGTPTRTITFTNTNNEAKYDKLDVKINVKSNFINLVDTVKTQSTTFFNTYFNQFEQKLIYKEGTPAAEITKFTTAKGVGREVDTAAFNESKYYVVVATDLEVSDVESITINGDVYADTYQYISIGNNSFILAPVWKIVDDKLLVALPYLVSSSTNHTVFDIVVGTETLKVQTYNNVENDEDEITLESAASVDRIVGEVQRVTFNTNTNTINSLYSYGTFNVGVELKAGDTAIPEGAYIFIKENGNMGIDTTTSDFTFGMYPRYNENSITQDKTFTRELNITIPGKGNIDLTFNNEEIVIAEEPQD